MTTDTQPMTPTDDEIDAIVYEQTGFDGDGTQSMTADEMRRVTRAVLAKWGAPPAVAGEQVDRADAVNLARNTLTQYDRAITKKGVRVLAEAVLSMDTALTTPQPTQAQAEPKSGVKSFQTYGEASAYSKGYYAGKKAATQAQAGAVPLTDEQRKDLLAASFCIAAVGDPTATIKPDDAERIINLLHEIGGIKGGQHGTE